MDLVELTNRYTPPSNPMEYLTEQGYFVIIRDEYNQLIPYCEGKPRNMGDVLILINNDLMFPNRTTELADSSDVISCNEVMETIDLTNTLDIPEELPDLSTVSDILSCNEVMETIDLTNTLDTPEELPDLSTVSDILRCNAVMEDTPKEHEITPPVIQQQPPNIKFTIRDQTTQSDCYLKECYDYMIMKRKVMGHIINNSTHQIEVCGTIDDLKALHTEILYHKGHSDTKFIF